MTTLPGLEWTEVDEKDLRAMRAALLSRLENEDRPDLVKKLAVCGEPLVMACVCCDATFTTEKRCRRRWCPVCAPVITAERYTRIGGMAARLKWPLAVTLTRANVTNAESCVQDLKDAFRKFRETVFWERNVRGGIASFEVTMKGRGFHPHIHALLDCEWLALETPKPRPNMSRHAIKALCERAHNELAEVWGAYVQGYRASVYVERAYGAAVEECLKYAVKPSELLTCACKASTIIDVIDKGRMVTTFGNCHACNKEFVGREDPAPVFVKCERCEGSATMMPDDIVDLYQRRPELASKRFHKLMSLAANFHDPAKEWRPDDTIPEQKEKLTKEQKAAKRARLKAKKEAMKKAADFIELMKRLRASREHEAVVYPQIVREAQDFARAATGNRAS